MMNRGGGYTGSLDELLPYHVAFPDWWESTGKYLSGSGIDRTFGMQRPSQVADQQWLDNAMKYWESQKDAKR